MMRRFVIVGVVCVLVMLLVALFVPSVLRLRVTAERMRCMDHMRRLSTILAQKNQDIPAGTVVGSAPEPESRLSWCVTILAYLGHADLATMIDQTASWDAAVNRRAGMTFVPTFACPSFVAGPLGAGYQPLHYPGIAGVGPDAALLPADLPRAGAFRYDAPTLRSAFRDGFAQCLVLLESGEQPNFWIAGGPSTVRPVDPATRPYLGSGRPFGGAHLGGANAAFADGSVRFLSENIRPDILERLAAIADGQEVGNSQ